MDSFPGRLTDGTFRIWLNVTVVILKRLIWHWCGQAAWNRETQCDSVDNRAKAKPELGLDSCFCNYLGLIPRHASKTSAEKWGLLFPKQWKCQSYRPQRFSSRHTLHWTKFGLVMSNLLFRLRFLQNNSVLFFTLKNEKLKVPLYLSLLLKTKTHLWREKRSFK